MAAETEIAVEALAAVIREFSVENAVAGLDRLAQSARSAQAHLTEDLDALDEAATALLAAMEKTDGRLLEGAQEVVHAVDVAMEGAEDKAEAMKTAAEETTGALEALDSAAELLAANLIEQLVTRTDEPAESLAVQVEEAATVLDRYLVALFRAVREVTSYELSGARKAIIENFGQRAHGAAGKEGQRLARFFEEWAGRVAGGVDALKKKTLDPAAAHPATAEAAMMESCAAEHREAFAPLLPLLSSLNELLAELQGDFVRVDGVLAGQLPELSSAIEELETILSTAVRELQTCAQLLSARLVLR